MRAVDPAADKIAAGTSKYMNGIDYIFWIAVRLVWFYALQHVSQSGYLHSSRKLGATKMVMKVWLVRT